ncbi:uncharacterized protein PG998_007370 [Apiospora kogelbergensis]|uniref:uncharacterized protein n=1 Tax=Apiospora kogelbergensis TaxID=1337665 RepID=UPI003130930D
MSRHSDHLSDFIAQSSAWDDQNSTSIDRHSHPQSPNSSDIESPCSADEAFHRVASTPFLPSASGANFGYLVKRLATTRQRAQPARFKGLRHRENAPSSSQRPRRRPTIALATSSSAERPRPSSGVDRYDDPLANGSTRVKLFGQERPTRDPSQQPLKSHTPLVKPGSGTSPSFLDATTTKGYKDSSSGGLSDDYGSSLSDGEDEDGGSDDTKVRHIAEQWSDLRERQRALHSTWGNIGREREALGDVRQKKNQAYNQVRFAINRILRDRPELDDLFREAERADLACQQVETNLETLLDGLEEEQCQLETEQRRFFTAIAQSEPSTETSSSRSHPESRTSLRGIQAERAEVLHPIIQTYEDALQELQLAQEFRTNLLVQKKLVDLEGEHIDEGSKEFLITYDDLQQQAHDEVDHWSRAVKERREACQKAALFGPNATDITTDIRLAGPSTPTLAHPLFPQLLSNPAHLIEGSLPQTVVASLRTATSLPPKMPGRKQKIEAASREFGIETLYIPGQNEGRQDYVNRWLLHKLRISAMEAELLSSTFQATLKILDWGQWQRDVLFQWTRDEAATQPMPLSKAFSNDYGFIQGIQDLLRTSTRSLSNFGDRTPKIQDKTQEQSLLLTAPALG